MLPKHHHIVRIGLIGCGPRGLATIERYRHIPCAQFVAVADLQPNRAEEAVRLLRRQEAVAEIMSSEELMHRSDVDLVLICTEWGTHAPLAVAAMEAGKDVAVEVPLANTIQKCRQILEAQSRTERRCFMLENCCYDVFHLGAAALVRQGKIGAVTHVECAYIHWLDENAAIGYHGNPYPTHGIGPMMQLLQAIDGDRMQSLVSIDAPNHINNTLIATTYGRSILLQFDETTPRPYNRLQTICGTQGFVQKYPLPTVQIGADICLTGKEAEDYVATFVPDEYQRLIDEGKRRGVKNLMNYIMDCRLMNALLTGQAFDISTQDAALWSSLCELTARSAQHGGERVSVGL